MNEHQKVYLNAFITWSYIEEKRKKNDSGIRQV